MPSPTAEDIVRRATVAFNAGQPDEAQEALRTGPAPRTRRSHAQSSARRRAVFQGRAAPARDADRGQPRKTPRQRRRRCCSRRGSRARAKDFDAALAHLDRSIAVAPQREAFVEKARTLDQAGLQDAQAREAWRAILEVCRSTRRPPARLGRSGLGRRRSQACRRTARTRGEGRCARLGLVRSRPGAAGSARPRRRQQRLSQGARAKARLCRGRAQSRHRAAGNRRYRRARCAPMRWPIACARRASAPSRWR